MTSLTVVERVPPPYPSEAPETVVALEGVSVKYRVPVERNVSLKEHLVQWRRRAFMEHVAIDQLDLTVHRGEALGVIGPNGAGKTTLLKVIAHILHPTSGRVRTRGQIASLIDLLGAFHPELTGYENVFLNCALLGLTRRETAARFPHIAGFADIGKFIDAPLRTYSSGMILRLGFAVATAVDADILVIDEALAVADAAFQQKCAARLREFRESGATFIIVSHDVGRLREMCDRILWLERGQARALGPSRDVVESYLGAIR